MFNSIITIKNFYGATWKEEMLIPKVIGILNQGYTQFRRIDRRLAVGHRRRGDVI